MHEYLFDVKAFLAVRVMARSEAEARAMIEANLSDEVNCGSWPDGQPIVATMGTDGEHDLMAVDGEYAG